VIRLLIQDRRVAASALAEIKLTAADFAGEHEIELVVPLPPAPLGSPAIRPRELTLRLGPVWACDGSPACVAALGEFGSVDIV
jgi:hypothetical protein